MISFRNYYFVFILFLLAGSELVCAQTGSIQGVVRDAETGETLPYANVFINNTSFGTSTSESGYFILERIQPGPVELVISFVGYNQHVAKLQVKAGEILSFEIRLVADNELAEVEVKGTRDKIWERQLKQFEKVFLGSSPFATACKILNPWVLEFREEKASGKSLFYASASRPIEIENEALGYRVLYYLRNFASASDAFQIQGQIRFEELLTSDERIASQWEQNRMKAYLGSSRHLFKALVDGRLKQEGFELYVHTSTSGLATGPNQASTFSSMLGNSVKPYPAEGIVRPGRDGQEFTIQFAQRIEVHYTKSYSQVRVYRDVAAPVSWLEVKFGMLTVDHDGIVLNPGNLIVSGAMYESRVGDQLPFNYRPGERIKLEQTSAEHFTHEKMLRLQEKVYLHTSKPYYYPGEKIWFKAYMNYRSPQLMDSMSRKLYVELIGPDQKIVQSGAWKIEYGMAHGELALPAHLQPGDYSLRSYTNWMRNYGSENFFVRPLPVLGPFERPASGIDPQPDTSFLRFTADKKDHKPREKVILEIAISNDDDDEFVSATFSVSVVDAGQVMEVSDRPRVADEFVFAEEEQSSISAEHPIEFGVTLCGQHLNAKGKPERASLLIVEGNLNDVTIADTDDSGNFWLTGFQFYDTTDISFQYAGKKPKQSGSIRLCERQIPPITPLGFRRSFEVVSVATPYRADSLAIWLDEVSVQATRGKHGDNDVSRVYGKPDFSITGEVLARSSATSLVNALRGRVPGFNVVLDRSGAQRVRLGTSSRYMGGTTAEPFLIIDNVEMAEQGGITVFEQLNQINPTNVEKVDVIIYGGAAAFGVRGSNGVIIVYTKERALSGLQSPSSRLQKNFFQVSKVAGYSTAPSIQFPDYSRKEPKHSIADHRSTIFWVPNLITDESGSARLSFYAADLPGQYRVMVVGMTSKGEPVSGTYYIRVTE